MRVRVWGPDVFLSLCLGFSLFSDFHVTACRSGLSDASQIPKSPNVFLLQLFLILTTTRNKYVFFLIGLKTLDLRAARLAQFSAHPSCHSSSGGVPPTSQITNVCLATAAILAERPARNRGEQRGADPSLTDAKTY